MNKFCKILIFLFLLNNLLFANEFKKVLILHSYHQAFEWTDRLNNGIYSVLDNSNLEIEYFIEYMDTKRFVNKEHYNNLVKTYTEKYKNIKFDLIISSDNNAFEFLKKYNHSIFKSTPVSFCGVNSLKKDDVKAFSNFTGTNEKADIRKNLKLIQTFHPNTKKVFVIIDETTTGNKIKKQVQIAISENRNNHIDFEFISDITYNDLKKKVKKLPPNSVILYTVFFRDKNNDFFEFNDVSRMLNKNSNAPIYSPWEFDGIIGGYSVSSYFQGQAAAIIGEKILNGIEIKKIPIQYTSPNKFIFNYENLIKYNIDLSLIPKNSLINNKPISFYEHYKKEIILIIILFVVMFIFIILLLGNIKKRKNAEVKTRKQLKFQQDLIDNVDTPIYYKDLEGRYIGCNKAFENFVSQSKENIMGKSIFGLVSKKCAYIYDLKDKEIFKTGIAQRYEEILEENEKQIKHLVFYKNVFYNEKNEIDGLIGVVFDITKLKEYSIKVDNQNKELIEANKSKDDFLANMSHELKTPLNSINIISSIMMKNKNNNLNEKEVKNLETINNCGKELLFLINDILDISKLESGEIIVNNHTFNLNNFIEKIKNSIEPQAKAKGLKLIVSYDTNIKEIYSDEQRLSQIIKNLLSNALKFTKEGEIKLTVSDSKNYLCITVEDEGIGIKKEKLDTIFERFKQVDSSTSRIYGGTGLGLAICKELSNLINASIDVQSILEKGSKFIITIPKEVLLINSIKDIKNIKKESIKKEKIRACKINCVNQQ